MLIQFLGKTYKKLSTERLIFSSQREKKKPILIELTVVYLQYHLTLRIWMRGSWPLTRLEELCPSLRGQPLPSSLQPSVRVCLQAGLTSWLAHTTEKGCLSNNFIEWITWCEDAWLSTVSPQDISHSLRYIVWSFWYDVFRKAERYKGGRSNSFQSFQEMHPQLCVQPSSFPRRLAATVCWSSA